MKLNAGSEKIASEAYEGWVSITVTHKINGKTAYVVTAKQAAMFDIKNIPTAQIAPLLGIGLPNIVYPYLRANVADAITRAGFPPVHLAQVNWETYYKQQRAGK